MAAALVHHEPGWRLPRLTALARRYSVSPAQVDAAIDELAARHLVRRLPDGQVYRASPAEYWVSLAGVPGLVSRVDPMGGRFACKSRHSARRRPPEDIGRSLGLAPGELAVAVRCVWTVGGEPGALSATYLSEAFAAALGELPTEDGASGGPGARDVPSGDAGALAEDVDTAGAPPQGNFLFPWDLDVSAARPRAVQLEVGLPPPSAARSLRMPPGEPVATVTISFAGAVAGAAVAITTATMRPELFRVVLAVPGTIIAGSSGGSPNAWTHAAGDWEP
jgi:DNA-binding GntR family transcriptional regulator